jgi:hypothetical protein
MAEGEGSSPITGRNSPTTFFVVQTAAKGFVDQQPSRIIVKLDVGLGSDALSQLIKQMDKLSFTLSRVDSSPIGELGSYHYMLMFDSKNGASITTIQSVLKPNAILLGAYKRSSVR